MIYILLPAFNEEKNLLKMFSKINNLYKKRKNIKIILVDDFSTDNTEKIVKKKYNFDIIYLKHHQNRGLSRALETGFKKFLEIANNNDLIVTLDSDNTHPILTIDTMIKKIEKNNDIVIASRFQKFSIVKGVNIGRKILSIGAKFIFKIFYPLNGLNDYTCNFRIYRHKLIKRILKEKSFFKNEEFNIAAKIIIFLIKKQKNLKINEVPFQLNYDYKIGASKMKILKTIFLTVRLIVNGSKK